MQIKASTLGGLLMGRGVIENRRYYGKTDPIPAEDICYLIFPANEGLSEIVKLASDIAPRRISEDAPTREEAAQSGFVPLLAIIAGDRNPNEVPPTRTFFNPKMVRKVTMEKRPDGFFNASLSLYMNRSSSHLHGFISMEAVLDQFVENCQQEQKKTRSPLVEKIIEPLQIGPDSGRSGRSRG